ncbi:MAG: glycosyltransferase family 2 protein, partial [Nitrosomonadaceae bacterium]|nr:glycosyltransferase family 2 protein [Nitrosomonadaceae bacterium]
MTASTDGSIEPLELSILMPCLNEAETVATCVRKAMGYIARTGIRAEVLVADNGSTDGSQALAEAEGARVVAVPMKGYGAALLGGIAAARGRYVIMADADDSYDFSALDAFVERLSGGDQLVMGDRFAGGIKPGAMPPLHRYLGNPVLSFIGRLLFRSPIRDFHCGLRGFDRDAIRSLNLNSPGMEFASEMIVKATLAKLRISD